MSRKPEGRFSIIPMHIFAIGHIAIIGPFEGWVSGVLGSAACFSGA